MIRTLNVAQAVDRVASGFGGSLEKFVETDVQSEKVFENFGWKKNCFCESLLLFVTRVNLMGIPPNRWQLK